MDKIVLHAETDRWLTDSILNNYIPDYGAYLEARRYSGNTRRVYVCCAAHFARWITKTGRRLPEINEHSVQEFCRKHLPQCDCPPPVRRSSHEIKAALRHLLEVLRAVGAIKLPRMATSLVEAEVLHFDAYMDQVCGYATNTRCQRVRIVRGFLAEQFGPKAVALTRITPAAVRRFALGTAKQKRCPGTIQVIRGTLRCYFRFRSIGGANVPQLLNAVPAVAHWRLATVPEVLTEEEIRDLLDSFQHLADSPKRGYAMARCLIDLGLRASEVVRLRLADVDWRAGTVRLVANKSRRVDILPLPTSTGTAIVNYIRAERPTSVNRALFVRHVAPYDKPIGAGVVRRVIREAYQRCGWTRTRVHTLRHTVASRLLRAGTPLKEIADVLRHRSLDTSVIYTKVDLRRLSAVAMPWPGKCI